MRTRWWWLRLQLWQWINLWRTFPVRRSLALLAWLLPAVVIPAALTLAGAAIARAGLEWLLSFDMPLALLLAAQVGAAVVALAARPDTEDWLVPAASRGAAGRALFAARLLHAVRWPAGLALAALLLSPRSHDRAHVIELLLIAFFALAGGASLAWLLLSRAKASRPVSATPSRSEGLSALSWVPLREVRGVLDLRRIALLAVPVLLAAPLASTAQQVLRALVLWVPLLYVGNWLRAAARTSGAIERWLPWTRLHPLRLYWWVWRYVVLATLLVAAVLWVGWRATAPVSAARR